MHYAKLAAICAIALFLLTGPAYAQPVCPSAAVAANPYILLTRTATAGPGPVWVFHLETAGGSAPEGVVGYFYAQHVLPSSRATVPPNGGTVFTTGTSNNNGTVLPNYGAAAGTFSVDPTCATGTLALGTGATPTSYRSVQFVFFNNFTEMYLLTNDNTGGVLVGTARLQLTPSPTVILEQ